MFVPGLRKLTHGLFLDKWLCEASLVGPGWSARPAGADNPPWDHREKITNAQRLGAEGFKISNPEMEASPSASLHCIQV